mmetsp:Transcript_31914/g.83305  ORF Transcript_31914/g.83305 Transcript_31914/m.83305 type:complete len:288 (-) Transcript_31914:1751-2614(-)
MNYKYFLQVRFCSLIAAKVTLATVSTSLASIRALKTIATILLRGREHTYRCAIHLALLRLLLLFFFLTLARGKLVNLLSVLFEHLDKVRHGIVHQVVPPRKLQNKIGLDEVVACEQASSKALLLLVVNKKVKNLIDKLGILGLGSSLHSILIEGVLLCKLDCLSPSLILLVKVGSHTSELNQVVVLKLLGKSNLVESVEGINRLPELFNVFFINVELVDNFVDSSDVVLLNFEEVRLGQGNKMGTTAKHVHYLGVIKARGEGNKELVQQERFLLKIEVYGTVVNLDV